MPAVEKRPQDEHAPEQKPVVGPDKWVRKPLANIPWEAMAPVSLDHVPMPLGPVPTPDKLPAELFSKPLGLYAETGFQPVKPADPLPREKRIDSYQQTLDGANYAAGNLKGQQHLCQACAETEGVVQPKSPQPLKLSSELLEDLKTRRAGSAQGESRQGDEADQASEDAEVALETRLMDRDAKLLREVERALEKVKNGTYGLCEGTDEPIGFKRLELRPWTRYSVAHKELLEREKQQQAR